MNFTHDQLAKMGYKVDQHGNYSRNQTLAPKVSNAKPKPDVRKALDTPAQAKARSQGRFIVCITRHSCRPLDADNFAGGCKPLIDQLRYAKLIPDDNPDCVELQFKQVKVSSKDKEGTEIAIKQI